MSPKAQPLTDPDHESSPNLSSHPSSPIKLAAGPGALGGSMLSEAPEASFDGKFLSFTVLCIISHNSDINRMIVPIYSN
jgi:hypothetical protein